MDILSREKTYKMCKDIALQTNLDKFLIYALIEVESARKIRAISKSGAYGLMQLKDIVVDDVNKYFDMDFKYHDIKNPVLNVKIGSLYIRRWENTYLKLGYPEFISTFLAILTYGWGYGNIRKWLSSKSSNEIIIKNIPQEKLQYNEKFMWWYMKLKEMYKNM